jgi:thiamine pyrophosphokinase
MHYIIITGGALVKGSSVEKAILDSDKIIAVDSGASHCSKLKTAPDLLVGDFDSIDPKLLLKLKKRKIPIIRFPKEKNETDTELAIKRAIQDKATEISVLAGLQGDRIDHILANVLLFQKYKVPIRFVSGNQALWGTSGPKTEKIRGKRGDLLSLIPLSVTSELRTKNLKYPLRRESLKPGSGRGVSNEFVARTVTVAFKKGTLLFIHTSLSSFA